MDFKVLDKALQEIITKREALGKLTYNHPEYDDLEEQLHDLEDQFQDKYGDEMEEILQKVHDDLCPDNEVLLPIAYIGKGVPVEIDKYAGKDTKLTLTASPARIILQIGKDKQEVVWTAK